MAPDLNSLPPSRSSTSSPLQPRSNLPTAAMEGQSSNGNNIQTPSSRSSSAAPAPPMNISTDLSHRSSLSGGHRSSPHSNRASISEGRRRSGIGMHFNMNLNESSSPSADNHEHRSPSFSSNFFRTASPTSLGGSPIIATGDPHHQRAPSLGELHQELEQEQEAQVNRLLQMIRQQQIQLHQLQQAQQQNPPSSSGTAVVDDITPNSERSQPFPSLPPVPTPGSRSAQQVYGSPFSTRRGSRASETMSPSFSSVLQPSPLQLSTQPSPAAIDPAHSSVGSEWSILAGGSEAAAPARRSSRDESAFYQAEAAMLTRENQMLQMRIRELERQLSALSAAATNNNDSISTSSTSNTNGASAGVTTGENNDSLTTSATGPAEARDGSEKT